MLKPWENVSIPPSAPPGPLHCPPPNPPQHPCQGRSFPQQGPDQCLSFPHCKSLSEGRISVACPGAIPGPWGAGVKVK